MTLENNIRVILECNFTIAKDEIIESATKRIMEQIKRQNPFEEKTNGEVLKILFPDMFIREINDFYYAISFEGVIWDQINKKWWNTPYKREINKENSCNTCTHKGYDCDNDFWIDCEQYDRVINNEYKDQDTD